MKYIVNSREMKRYDQNTSAYFFIPPIVLMERAAVAFVLHLKEKKLDLSQTLVVCGMGNNGGDGLAIARMLKLEGFSVDIVLAEKKESASEQNLLQQKILDAYQYPVLNAIPEGTQYTIIIDALFGVGLSRTITGEYSDLIMQMNRITGKRIAVDISSGISADNGSILGTAFRADFTITFAYQKTGMVLWPGNEYSGEVIVCDIGINEKSWMGKRPSISVIEDKDLYSVLPARSDHSNKGSYGKLLIIAGSINMAGAAILCGKAAYAAGCGLVRICTAEENRSVVQTALPEAVLATYQNRRMEEDSLKEALKWADAVICGPGIGKEEPAAQIVELVLTHADSPVLLDADALNLISEHADTPDTPVSRQTYHKLNAAQVPIVITPHLGEMSRLTGSSVTALQTDLLRAAKDFSETNNICCVLKDFRTVTCVPDDKIYLNLSGNHGMATAGSGDVLSGIIGSLMAQGMNRKEAAPFGVYLHGRAGDAAAEKTGYRGLMASDMIEGIRLYLSRLER